MSEKQELEKINEDGTAVVDVEAKEEEQQEQVSIEPQGTAVQQEAVDVEQEQEETQDNNQDDGDDLVGYSEKVRARINKLTFDKREAERLARGAVEHAKGVQRKLSEFEKRYSVLEDTQFKEMAARIDAQTLAVKENLRKAHQEQDFDKIMESQSQLTELAVQKERAKIQAEQRKFEQEVQAERAETPQEQPIDYGQQLPQPSAKASAWAAKNEWFGNDEVMTQAAYSIHNQLIQQGVDPESDAYYNTVDKQLRDYFPQRFAKKQERSKPVQTVAPAGRTNSGRRTVRLTKRQVEMAKRLNVPLTEYAKYVKEGA
jgi:hypothetical protein